MPIVFNQMKSLSFLGVNETKVGLEERGYFDKDKGISEEPQSHLLTENVTIKGYFNSTLHWHIVSPNHPRGKVWFKIC